MSSHQALNGIYLNQNNSQIVLGSDATKAITIHTETPSATVNYSVTNNITESSQFIFSGGTQTISSGTKTFSDITSLTTITVGNSELLSLATSTQHLSLTDAGTNSTFVVSHSNYTQSITTPLILSGTISGGNYEGASLTTFTISNATFSENNLLETISGGIGNSIVFTNGTVSSSVVNNAASSSNTISNTSLVSSTLTGVNFIANTFTNHSFIDNKNTISNVFFKSGTILSNVNVLADISGIGDVLLNTTLTSSTLTEYNYLANTLSDGHVTNCVVTTPDILSANNTNNATITYYNTGVNNTFYNGTISLNNVNLGTISGCTLSSAILSGHTNVSTISNATVTNTTLTNDIINLGTISGGDFQSITLSNNNCLSGTISNGTLSNILLQQNINNTGTITNGYYSNITGISGTNVLSENLIGATCTNVTFVGQENTLTQTLSAGYLQSNSFLNNTILLSTITTSNVIDGSFNGCVVNTLTTGALSNMTFLDANYLDGTLSNGSVSNVTLGGTISNFNTLSGGFISGSTFSTITMLDGTITNGNYLSSTFTDNSVIVDSLTGGTLTVSYLCGSLTQCNTTTGGYVDADLTGSIALCNTLSDGTLTGVVNNAYNTGDSFVNGGNVGIGTTSPSSTLHVVGSVAANVGTFTTLNVTGDPTTSTQTFYGDYGVFQLSGTTYTFNGSGTDSKTLTWNTTADFAQNITQSQGVFYFAVTGIYLIEIQLRVATTVTTDIITYLQSSLDGSTGWTSSSQSGAKPSQSWTGNSSEYVMQFAVDARTTQYWRLLIQCSSAVTAVFLLGEMSRIMITGISSSYGQNAVYLYGNAASSAATGGNGVIYISQTISSGGNEISQIANSYYSFSSNGTYLIYVKGSSYNIDLSAQSLTRINVYNTYQANTTGLYWTTEKIINLGNYNSMFSKVLVTINNSFSLTQNVYLQFYNGQPTNVFWHSLTSFVIIKKISDNICNISSPDYTTTYAKNNTISDFKFYSMFTNRIVPLDTSRVWSALYIPINGLYLITITLELFTTYTVDVPITCYTYVSPDNVNWNLQYTTIDYINGSNSNSCAQTTIYIIVNDSSRYVKCAVSSSYNGVLSVLQFKNVGSFLGRSGLVCVACLSSNLLQQNVGLVQNKYISQGTVVSRTIFPFSHLGTYFGRTIQYGSDDISSSVPLISFPSGYISGTPLFQCVFTPKLNPFYSNLTFAMDGYIMLTASATTQYIYYMIIEYKNSNTTEITYTSKNNPGTNTNISSSELTPFVATFVNSSPINTYNTITIYLGGNQGYSYQLTNLDSWVISLTETVN